MWAMRLNIVDWGYFKIQTLQAILKSQNQHQAEFSCIFWKSNICTNQLDVQEANVSVSQLHRIKDHIVGCWFAYGRTCAFDL